MSRCQDPLTPDDRRAVRAFANFLSWGSLPAPGERRSVPPAWYAYALGATSWCPPEGEW